jgi:GxxExxY protein
MRLNKPGKIIYPELSYKIIGAAYRVFNDLNWGMDEKYYQRALADELSNLKIKFMKEFPIVIKYNNNKIGTYFADFLIEDKILIELKIKPRLGYIHSRQVLEYLKRANIKLAILIYFTKNGVKYRRVLNSHYSQSNHE